MKNKCTALWCCVLRHSTVPRTSYSLTTFGWSNFFRMAISRSTLSSSSGGGGGGVCAAKPMPLLAETLRRAPLRSPARGRCSVRTRQLRFIICGKQRGSGVHIIIQALWCDFQHWGWWQKQGVLGRRTGSGVEEQSRAELAHLDGIQLPVQRVEHQLDFPKAATAEGLDHDVLVYTGCTSDVTLHTQVVCFSS
jgi:hypothetical protein